MAQYFLNNRAQTSGEHEVHREDCQFMPGDDLTRLGDHADCHTAVAAARKILPQANGCYHCAHECHTG